MLKVAVIGLGRFGMTVARRLAASGVEVIAIDRTTQLVNEIKDEVDLAVRLDSTDRQALLSQEIDKVDVCVVSIGENFEASLLTTVLVRQLGVPKVVCRAQTAPPCRDLPADRGARCHSARARSRYTIGAAVDAFRTYRFRPPVRWTRADGNDRAPAVRA